MNIPFRTLRKIARLMLGVVLFAQGVVAVNACDLLNGKVEHAFIAPAATEMPCHEHPAANANVCFVHCTQGDQVNVDHVVPPFITPSTVVLTVALPEVRAAKPVSTAARVALDTGPPLSVRFCSFQI